MKGAVKIVLLIAYFGKGRFTVEEWKMGTPPPEKALLLIYQKWLRQFLFRREYNKYVASDNLILKFEYLFLRNQSPP